MVTAVDVDHGGEIERAIATFASQPDSGLIVGPKGGSMTLVNMRENSVRSLSVMCEVCRHGALLNVYAFPRSDAPMSIFLTISYGRKNRHRRVRRSDGSPRHRAAHEFAHPLSVRFNFFMHLLPDRQRIRAAEFWSGDRETWFPDVSFQSTGRKSYGHAETLNEATVGFRAEYAAWRERQNGQDCRRDQCKR